MSKYLGLRSAYIQYPSRETDHIIIFQKSTTRPKYSTTSISAMAASSVQHKAGEHLSDVHIAMILTLDKVMIPQRQIAALIKTSKTAVQRALQTNTFETFQGCNAQREYKRKTRQR